MSYEEAAALVASIAEAAGCEYHYYDEGENDVIKTPYLLFDYPDRSDMQADDRNYMKIQRINVEYDSKTKDIDAEHRIEAVLDAKNIAYTKQDTRYEGHDAYGVMYSWEVAING